MGELVTLELKVCERCGALWLRPRGAAVRECGRCERKVREMGSGAVFKRGRRASARSGERANR